MISIVPTPKVEGVFGGLLQTSVPLGHVAHIHRNHDTLFGVVSDSELAVKTVPIQS